MAQDLRELIFAGLGERRFTAHLSVETEGLLAGVTAATGQAEAVGLHIDWLQAERAWLCPGTVIATVSGSAQAIAMGEERLPGCLGKASGIAASARKAVDMAGGRVRVVSGAWKKMPPEIKMMIRAAVAAGGMPTRILDVPFVYLDKNYVRMLGGIEATLLAVKDLAGVKVIQVRGEEASISLETERACRLGAGVVMVDTGRRADLAAALAAAAAYPQVRVAFAGGIRHEDIPGLAATGVDILDIGTVIMDAPLLDVKLDVIKVENFYGI